MSEHPSARVSVILIRPDIARDVQIEIAVVVLVEERRSLPDASALCTDDPRFRRDIVEGPAGILYWSWAWVGSWLSLLSPVTWWDNLTHKTRWSRIGDFEECQEVLVP